jgi:serine/threonine-protein kinase
VSPTPVAASPVKASPSPVKPKPVDNSSTIIKRAEEKYQSGDLPGAIAQLQGILASGSAAKNEAVATIAKWQQEWVAAEAKFNEVQQALNEGRWDDVLVHQSDTGFPEQRYWRGKLNELIDEAKRRKAEAEANQQPTPPTPSPSGPTVPEPTPPTPSPSVPTESVTPAPSPSAEVPAP